MSKICQKCGKSHKDTHKRICGACYQRQRKKDNPEKVKEAKRRYSEKQRIKGWPKKKSYALRNYKAWIDSFIEIYGQNPRCEICGKTLSWKGLKTKIVHWDHKDEKCMVKKDPSHFLHGHIYNEGNRKIWHSLDLGCLCLSCNTRLPTKNRIRWLRKALKYTQKTRQLYLVSNQK